MSEENKFLHLKKDLKNLIFSYLSKIEQFRIFHTCKNFQNIISKYNHNVYSNDSIKILKYLFSLKKIKTFDTCEFLNYSEDKTNLILASFNKFKGEIENDVICLVLVHFFYIQLENSNKKMLKINMANFTEEEKSVVTKLNHDLFHFLL
jgi:hypothetical protein